MADEPVAAYAEPWTRTLTRWVTRHRTGVTGAAAACLALMLGLAVVTWVQAQGKAALAAKNGELEAANRRITHANADLEAANAKVEARYVLAFEAIKTYHTGVSEDFLLKQDQFKALHDQLLKSAADFYGRLSALLGREADPESRRALAASNFELAVLTARVGQNRDALAAHRAVLAAREALAAEPGAGAAAKADVGRSLTAIASLSRAAGRTDEALTAYRRAEALFGDLAATDLSARVALAACRSLMGSLLAETAKTEEALAAYHLARADQEALAATPGDSSDVRGDLAETALGIADLLRRMGRQAEAEYRAALAIYQQLTEDHPDVMAFRSGLARSHNNFAVLLRDTPKQVEAEEEYRAALAIHQQLTKDHPAVTDFRRFFASSRHNLATVLGLGRPVEAEEEYRAALAISQKLVDDHPDVIAFRDGVAFTHNALGQHLKDTGRHWEAEEEYRAALAIHQQLADDHPDVIAFRVREANAHSGLGWLLFDGGRSTEAEAVLRQAQVIYQELADDHPAVAYLRSPLAFSHRNLGLLLSQTGKPSEAEAECRAGLTLLQELVDDDPKVPGYRMYLAEVHTFLSVVLRRLGRASEALDHAERAVAAREALIKMDPSVSGEAEQYLNLGLARRALGNTTGAVADIRRALGMPEQVHPWAAWYFDAACLHAALAGLAGQDGSGVSASEGASEAETAMALLRQAVALAYRSAAFRYEDALDPLRDRDDFKLLLMDLAFPAEPFAAAP
jgi:tetratricopeptide (TPR) repeat protein